VQQLLLLQQLLTSLLLQMTGHSSQRVPSLDQ
jgi:hypothetical protein